MITPFDVDVDAMPADPDLLTELGRAAWAAARLHAGVRDAINAHRGVPSDAPFELTLGQAIAELEKLAAGAAHRQDQVDWVAQMGRPASRQRNGLIHAVAFTATDGRQAIRTANHSAPGRFQRDEIRDVTRVLIHASMTLPR